MTHYIQNKSPFAFALGDCFLIFLSLLTSKASPNAWMAIIIVIIIGEGDVVSHELAYYSTILKLIL